MLAFLPRDWRFEISVVNKHILAYRPRIRAAILFNTCFPFSLPSSPWTQQPPMSIAHPGGSHDRQHPHTDILYDLQILTEDRSTKHAGLAPTASKGRYKSA